MTDNTSKGRSQTALLREHLESGKPITMLQALRLFGIGNLKGRIYDIRKQGVEVRRNWAMFVAQSGHAGHYAVYWVERPGVATEEMKAAMESFEAFKKHIDEAAKEGLDESREFWGQLEKDGVTISPSALDSEETAIDLFG